jgi:hypothetical protein
MKERERQHPEPPRPARHYGAPSATDTDLRDQAERLLAAGAAAIAQAQSTDSTAYLEANRQEDGQ